MIERIKQTKERQVLKFFKRTYKYDKTIGEKRRSKEMNKGTKKRRGKRIDW